MRNVGAVPLVIDDRPGDGLGSAGAAATLTRKTSPIAPHHTGPLVVGCRGLQALPGGFVGVSTHTFTTNDPYPAHASIEITVDVPNSACPGCDKGCTGFVYRPLTGSTCADCRHDALNHGVDPVDPGSHPVMIRDGDLDGSPARAAATTPTRTDYPRPDETPGVARWL